MAVAKRQGRETPTKTNKGRCEDWSEEEQTALLASVIYIGQAQGEGKTYKKGARRLGVSLSPAHTQAPCLSFSLSSLHAFWVGMPSRLEDVFSLIFQIKLICLRTITWPV